MRVSEDLLTSELIAYSVVVWSFEIRHDDTASEVKIDSFPQSILACCEERCDDWFFTVKVSLHTMKQQIFSFIC